MPDLSVIIPAYNEERRLPATLASVYGYLVDSGRNFEVIVVDDGSLDHTVAVVESFAQHHDKVRLLSYSPNQGKGHAIRIGMLAAHGEMMLFDDADGSSPISEIERLESAIANGADIAIGSRAKPDPTRKVEALAYRKHIGNTFNLIVQSLLLPGIYDTQCGFKLFKREAARNLFSIACVDGFGFDVEVLSLARMRNYKITEVGINWHSVEGSKVNVLIDSPRMLLEVIDVWLRTLFGIYKRQSAHKGILPLVTGSVKGNEPTDSTARTEQSSSQITSEPARE